MKTKTNNLLALMTFLLCTISLQAQPPGGGRGMQMTEEDIEERVEQMAKTLELTKEQHDKYLAVEMDFFNKIQIERQKMRSSNERPNREEMREKMLKQREEHDKQVKEIFTEEQFTRYKEIQEQRRSEMQQNRRENSPSEEAQPQRGRGRN